MTKTVRILSIDSGGTLGIIPSTVLEYLENKIGKPIAECFHIIAGTSTGALAAANLCRPLSPLSATDIKNQYFQDSPRIFDRSLWHRIESMDGTRDEKFDAANLETILAKQFGSLMLSDINITHFMTCAYEIEQRRPILFRSWKAQGHLLKPEKGETQTNQNYLLRDILRGASAAPTAFEPAHIHNMAGDNLYLIDGGVYAINPVRIAITQARKLYPHATQFLITSLACNTNSRKIPYEQAINWGSTGWLFPILDILVNAQPQITDYDLDEEFSANNYYRFFIDTSDIQGTFSHPVYYDGRPTTLEKVGKKGEALVEMEMKRLDELAEKLKTPRG